MYRSIFWEQLLFPVAEGVSIQVILTAIMPLRLAGSLPLVNVVLPKCALVLGG